MADDIDALLEEDRQTPVPAAATGQAPVASPAPAPTPTANGNPLSPAGQIGASIVTGAAESVFQTKDFIFGAPKEEEKSQLRKSSEALRGELNAAGMANNFVGTLSQFAVGMLGAGKLVSAAKALPGVGGAVAATEASRKGAAALEVAKAAGVGAVAFDPNGQRLSNLVQAYPALQNPVTGFLAAQPGDTAAVGRMKNALESIGMDAALIGVFAGTMRGYKALRSGDVAEVRAAETEILQAQQQQAFDARLKEDPAAAMQEHPELAVQRAIRDADDGIAAEAQAALQADRQHLMDTEFGSPADIHAMPDSEASSVAAATRKDYQLAPKGFDPARVVEPGGLDRRAYGIMDGDQEIGTVTMRVDGDTAHIRDITSAVPGVFGFRDVRGSVGSRAMMGLLKQFARENPQVTTLVGERVSGARRGGKHDFQGTGENVTIQIPDSWRQAPEPVPGEVALPEQSVTLDTQVTRVDNPTQAGAPVRRAEAIQVSDADVENLIRSGVEDSQQIFGPGGWEGAIERGHVFGRPGSIPWQKFARVSEDLEPYDFMVARIGEQIKAQIDKVRGGNAEGVMTGAMVDRVASSYLRAYNLDAEATRGLLAQAGKDSVNKAAQMEAGFILAQRRNMDVLNLKTRIQLGALDEFNGDKAAAVAALKEMYGEAANLMANALAIRASAGRVLRRNRLDFQIQFEDLAAVKSMDDDRFLGLLDAAGRDPLANAKMMRPGLLGRIGDDLQYLYVNNLLWGLRTHFINLTTNTFQLLGRPAQRLAGYALQGNGAGAREAWSQYGYMGASIADSFREAVQAWKTGDSVLSPHTSELTPAGAAANSRVNYIATPYKPMDSVPNLLANAYLGLMKGLGLPTRALGFTDELSKQMVYRSKVQSRAFAEGVEMGLEGADLTDHVKRALFDSFDDAGRAVDLPALQEANVATFQQDLLTGEDTTFGPIGRLTQQFVANVPVARFVLPFVKTPINVIREGAKLTPGLNLLQKEYRQMIGGTMGEEMQAQAIGQMAMGSLFLGTAAMLAHSGYVTGGGPTDPNARKQLMATGWQPYSFIVPQADGSKRYVNFGRYDPVALPFGLVADIVDVLSRDYDGDAGSVQAMEAAKALGIALAKQFSSKTYLQSLNGVIEAISEPEKGGVEKFLGQTAANFLPGSSGLRFWNSDPYLREARDLSDRVLATLPGASQTLPPVRDVFGDPVYVHKGLWVDGSTSAVDQEIARMVDEEGRHLGPPQPSPSGKVDLRDITLSNGRNAYDQYQEWAGKPPGGAPPLREIVGRMMKTEGYRKAPDGDAQTKGTKQAILTGIIGKYRQQALARVNADPVMRRELLDRERKARAAFISQQAAPARPSPLGLLSGAGR